MTRGEQLLQSVSPNCNFKLSDNFFDGFTRCYKISLCSSSSTLHKAQVIPSRKTELRMQSQELPQRTPVRYTLYIGEKCMAIVDQTPLPFIFTIGLMYRCKYSEAEKSMVKVQGQTKAAVYNVFAVGILCVKPEVIFSR